MFKKFIIAAFSLMLIFGSLSIVNAQIIPASKPCPDLVAKGYNGNCGNYEINDFIILAVKVSNWILSIVGSLVLLMFIYGGFMFLISAGSSESITKAKNILIAAVIGLIIVFSSWLIIKFVIGSMGLDWKGTTNTMAPVPDAVQSSSETAK